MEDGLIGEGAGARDDTDVALLVNITRGDADAAAAVRVLASARRDDAGTVGADEPGLAALHGALDLDHVAHRDALGDGDAEVEARVHTLKNGVGGEWRRHEHGGERGYKCRRMAGLDQFRVGSSFPVWD